MEKDVDIFENYLHTLAQTVNDFLYISHFNGRIIHNIYILRRFIRNVIVTGQGESFML